MGFRGSVSRSSNLLVSDLVALIDALGADRVFVVGHDWGAIVAWQMCMFRPDRVRALQNLSVAYRGRNPDFLPIDTLKAGYGEDYYICRFQAPGEIEEVPYENFSILVVGASFLNQGVMVQRIPYLPFS